MQSHAVLLLIRLWLLQNIASMSSAGDDALTKWLHELATNAHLESVGVLSLSIDFIANADVQRTDRGQICKHANTADV